MEFQVGNNEVLLCVDPTYFCGGGEAGEGGEGKSSELSLLQQVSKFKPLTDWLGSFSPSERSYASRGAEDGAGEVKTIALSKITVRNVSWISRRIASVVADVELVVKTTSGAVDPVTISGAGGKPPRGGQRKPSLSKITQSITLTDPSMTATHVGSSASSASGVASAKAILLPIIISSGNFYGLFCHRRDRITKPRSTDGSATGDSIDVEALFGSIASDGKFAFEPSVAPIATAAMRAAGFDVSDSGLSASGSGLLTPLLPLTQPASLIFADGLQTCAAYSVTRAASATELSEIANELKNIINGVDSPANRVSVQIVPLYEIIKRGNDLKAVTAASLAVTEVASAGTA